MLNNTNQTVFYLKGIMQADFWTASCQSQIRFDLPYKCFTTRNLSQDL